MLGLSKHKRDRLALQIVRNMAALEKSANAGAWKEASALAARQDPLLARYLECEGASEEHLCGVIQSHGGIRSVEDTDYQDWICDELFKRGLQPI